MAQEVTPNQTENTSSTTYNFSTSAEHGTVYNGNFTGGTFHSGYRPPSHPPSNDFGPDYQRPGGHPQVQRANDLVSTYRYDCNGSNWYWASPSQYHGRPSPEAPTQHQQCHHSQGYPPCVTANCSEFTALHEPYGSGHSQRHASSHVRQVQGHPAFHSFEADPSTYCSKAHAARYNPQLLFNPADERLSYYPPAGQAPFHVQGFQAQAQPHGEHMLPHAQHYVPPQDQPEPRHAFAMPVPQHYGPGQGPAADASVFPPPNPLSNTAPHFNAMARVLPYHDAPTPALTPVGSRASSERSSGPSTPRVFMPCPSVPGKPPGWVTGIPDDRQLVDFPEARHH